MALPGNVPSTNYHPANYLPPYDRYKDFLIDYEQGGIALNDGSQGMQVQFWTLVYDADEESNTYGDFTVIPESFGEPTVIFNIPGVVEIGLAFNTNMDIFITWLLDTGECKYYWYDALTQQMVTSTLPAGSTSPVCCLDDHRFMQDDVNDIILAYLLDGDAEYRQQRDRFDTPRTLATAVGQARLYRVGMQDNFRLKFDLREGRGVRLSEIVGDLLTMVGFPARDFDVSELYPIVVRGFLCAGGYSAADAIRSLQTIYFFDMPEVDGKLKAILRGGEVVATIYSKDTIIGSDIDIETAREQGVEYPAKVHVAYQCAEYDYTTSTETSERRTPDVLNVSEIAFENPVNMEPDEVAQVATKLHKVSANELEGNTKRTLPFSYIYLIPSDCVNMEIGDGQFKRMRIQKYDFVDGTLVLKAVIDRVSSYFAAEAVAADGEPPTPPPKRLPGATTWEYMNLPALVTAHDTLHKYVAGYGNETAWRGAVLQREVGVDFEREGEISFNETMGVLAASVPDAPREYTDTTNTILATLNNAPESVSDALMLQGKGAWLVGNEIIQVRDWVAVGDDWQGSHLYRGRLDTVTAAHSVDDRVVFLGAPALVLADVSDIGIVATYRAVSYGSDPVDAVESDHTFEGESQTEWAPAFLQAVKSGSDWVVDWMPRHRLGNSATPLASLNYTGFRIKFTKGATTAIKDVGDVDTYTYSSADQTTDFGSAQATWDSIKVMALNRYTGEGRHTDTGSI